MGAWGHGHFEDDSALDFMDEIESADDPKEIINDALVNALEGDYLESDECNAVIVAAAYVDHQVNGTKFSPEDYDDALDIDTFHDRQPGVDLSDLRDTASAALGKVLSDGSELNELWSENEEDYPALREGIRQLIRRLSSN